MHAHTMYILLYIYTHTLTYTCIYTLIPDAKQLGTIPQHRIWQLKCAQFKLANSLNTPQEIERAAMKHHFYC